MVCKHTLAGETDLVVMTLSSRVCPSPCGGTEFSVIEKEGVVSGGSQGAVIEQIEEHGREMGYYLMFGKDGSGRYSVVCNLCEKVYTFDAYSQLDESQDYVANSLEHYLVDKSVTVKNKFYCISCGEPITALRKIIPEEDFLFTRDKDGALLQNLDFDQPFSDTHSMLCGACDNYLGDWADYIAEILLGCKKHD